MTRSGNAISYHGLVLATALADKGAVTRRWLNSQAVCVCVYLCVADISKTPADTG